MIKWIKESLGISLTHFGIYLTYFINYGNWKKFDIILISQKISFLESKVHMILDINTMDSTEIIEINIITKIFCHLMKKNHRKFLYLYFLLCDSQKFLFDPLKKWVNRAKNFWQAKKFLGTRFPGSTTFWWSAVLAP